MENHEVIVAEIKKHFDGRDLIGEANDRIDQMDHAQLKGLIFVAANRLGIALKGGDYEDAVDAAIHLSGALKIIFDAYDNADLLAAANTMEGSA